MDLNKINISNNNNLITLENINIDTQEFSKIIEISDSFQNHISSL